MKHSHHNHCEHEEVAYCGHCSVVYCKGCKKEWGECKFSHWTYTYPWYVTSDPYVYTTTTDSDPTYTWDSATDASADHDVRIKAGGAEINCTHA